MHIPLLFCIVYTFLYRCMVEAYQWYFMSCSNTKLTIKRINGSFFFIFGVFLFFFLLLTIATYINNIYSSFFFCCHLFIVLEMFRRMQIFLNGLGIWKIRKKYINLQLNMETKNQMKISRSTFDIMWTIAICYFFLLPYSI